MPEKQKPAKSTAPATSAAAKQMVARVPEHYTGLSVQEFEKWSAAYRQQHLRDATPGFMKTPSAALDL